MAGVADGVGQRDQALHNFNGTGFHGNLFKE
jgi:hypothetical protein